MWLIEISNQYVSPLLPELTLNLIHAQDNILITKKGRACLADFGLVSVFDTNDQRHTVASEVEMGGTYPYMAPEIFKAINSKERREVNKRACDMYALGGTIYAVCKTVLAVQATPHLSF